MPLLLLTLLACTWQGASSRLGLVLPEDALPVDSAAVQDSGPAEDSAPPPPPDAPLEDIGAPPEAHVEEEAVPETGDLSGRIFNDDEVHTIDIYLDGPDYNALLTDPYTYVAADFTFDGMRMEDVGLRLKGKIGSFRTLRQKAAFKVDLNAFVPGRDLYGVNKFNLNNMAVDCSHMKEHLGYHTLASLGLPSLRAGWAWVRVNGEDYGLYNLLEHPDEDFLAQNYEDSTGNLYDGKYIWYGGWSYTLLDFNSSVHDLYPLEEGTDVGHADVHGVSAAIAVYGGTANYYSKMGGVVEWEQVLRYLAWEQWVGHNDGYSLNTNNNFLYFKADDGKMNFLPWDLDYSFLEDYQWGMNWASPRGLLAWYCMTDTTTCREAWKAQAQVLLDTVDTADQLAYLDQIQTLTSDYIDRDPRRECRITDVESGRAAIRAWVSNRPTYLRSFWGL